MSTKPNNNVQLTLVVISLIFLLFSSFTASANIVTSTKPNWGGSTTYYKKSEVTYYVYFYEAVDESTVKASSFQFGILGGLHNASSVQKVSDKKYAVTGSGSWLTDDYKGSVALYLADSNIKTLSGVNVSNPFGHGIIDGFIDNRGTGISFQNLPSEASGPFEMVLDLDEVATVADADAFVVQNATKGPLVAAYNQRSYTVLITPSFSGPVTLEIKAGLFKDAPGNFSSAVASTKTIPPDETPPSVSFDRVPRAVSGTSSFTAAVLLSEAVAGFTMDDLLVKNATVLNFQKVNSETYSVELEPDGTGDLSMTVPANVMKDAAGNSNTASKTVTVIYDTKAPSVSSIMTSDDDPADGTISWTVEFSEGVDGVSAKNFSVEGVEGADITVTPIGEEASLMTPTRILAELFGVTPAHARSGYYSQYRVTVSGGNVATITNNVVLVFGSSTGITDSTGQNLASVTPTGVNQSTVTQDSENPSVVQMVAPAKVTGSFTTEFIFSEAVTGFTSTDINVSNGTVTGLTAQAESGGFATIFNATILPKESGTVAIFVVQNAVADAAGNQNAQSRTLNVAYLDEPLTQRRTSSVIRNFLVRRNANIVANQPDLSGRLSDRGGLGVSETFSMSSSYSEGDYRLNFAGSLTRLASKEAIDTLGVGSEEASEIVKKRFNVWIKGSLAQSNNGNDVQDFGALHVGADYLFTPKILVGAMVQFDWSKEKNDKAATRASGNGWMVGPYLVTRIHQNAIFDAHVAYGQSDNKVSPYNTYSDSFKTTRFFAKAQLTGDFKYGEWTLAPQASITYIREKQAAYTDSNAINIPSQVVDFGQFAFGPTVSRSIDLSDDVRLTANLAFKGLWNFQNTGLVNINSGSRLGSSNEEFDTRLEAGLGLQFAKGMELDAQGYYIGLGKNNQESYGGSMKVVVPF